MAQTATVKIQSPWSPLKIATFRWLWLATLVSNTGSWMHEVGAGWLMTTLTTSPVMVALMQTAGLRDCEAIPMSFGAVHLFVGTV